MPDHNDDAPINIRSELQKTFDEAIRKHASKSISHASDWEKQTRIEEKFDRKQEQLQGQYNGEYTTRVEVERRRLMHDAGAYTLNHPAPHGTDRFNPDDLTRQAERNVRTSHEGDVMALNEERNNALENNLHSARQKEAVRGKAKEQFAKSRDRRQGPERRGPRRSR